MQTPKPLTKKGRLAYSFCVNKCRFRKGNGMKNRQKPVTAGRKRIRRAALILLLAVLIGFGSVYIYYSTGNDAEDPEGFASIRGLNNAEDMVQIGDTKWILAGNLGDKSWKNGGFYLIDSVSRE